MVRIAVLSNSSKTFDNFVSFVSPHHRSLFIHVKNEVQVQGFVFDSYIVVGPPIKDNSLEKAVFTRVKPI